MENLGCLSPLIYALVFPAKTDASCPQTLDPKLFSFWTLGLTAEGLSASEVFRDVDGISYWIS